LITHWKFQLSNLEGKWQLRLFSPYVKVRVELICWPFTTMPNRPQIEKNWNCVFYKNILLNFPLLIKHVGLNQNVSFYVEASLYNHFWGRAKREGVGTSNFTTTTGHFYQNIKSVFLVYHYYYIRTWKV